MIFLAQDVCCIEQFILGPDSASCYAGTEEYTFGSSALMQFTEQPCEFIGFKGCTAKITPGTEWTIELVNYICALAGLTSTSRMMYAFARDGGLPASEALAKVSTVYRTPGTAVWVSAIFAFASTLYAPAYLILAVACAVFLYISMVMPIAAGLIAEGSAKWKEKGPFNLGGLSKPNAFLAIIFGIVLAISGFFPPNEKVFYFTVVFVVALFGFWSKKTAPMGIGFAVVGLLLGFLPISDENVLHFLIPDLTTSTIAIGVAVVAAVITFMTGGEDQRFEGVPEGDKIKQRQKMIADIEKKYGEQ